MTEEDDPKYVEQGAEIADQDTGVIYRVTLGYRKGRPYLTSLQIDARGASNKRVGARVLDQANTDQIAHAAAQFLTEQADNPDQPLVLLPDGVRVRGEQPDLAELAQRYREIGAGATVREYGQEYGVSKTTVNRWIAAAREAGHLEPVGQTSRTSSNTKPSGGGRSGKTTTGK